MSLSVVIDKDRSLHRPLRNLKDGELNDVPTALHLLKHISALIACCNSATIFSFSVSV